MSREPRGPATSVTRASAESAKIQHITPNRHASPKDPVKRREERKGTRSQPASGRTPGVAREGPRPPAKPAPRRTQRLRGATNHTRESIRIGVHKDLISLDVVGRCSWVLGLGNGRLLRYCRDANGAVVHPKLSPPPGFPDGQLTQVMKDEAGQPTDLRDRATGAVIEVLVDHDAGTLRYRINGASRRTTASRRAPRCGRAPHWLDMRTV